MIKLLDCALLIFTLLLLVVLIRFEKTHYGSMGNEVLFQAYQGDWVLYETNLHN
tara:strand:- start:403 stop:564 length:162 start_codon:yes stop_codon:yes gene_type:complete